MMTDNDLMPFGKYQGIPLKDVPDDYLLWLYNQDIHPKYSDLEDYLEENIDGIKANINKNRWYNKEE